MQLDLGPPGYPNDLIARLCKCFAIVVQRVIRSGEKEEQSRNISAILAAKHSTSTRHHAPAMLRVRANTSQSARQWRSLGSLRHEKRSTCCQISWLSAPIVTDCFLQPPFANRLTALVFHSAALQQRRAPTARQTHTAKSVEWILEWVERNRLSMSSAI